MKLYPRLFYLFDVGFLSFVCLRHRVTPFLVLSPEEDVPYLAANLVCPWEEVSPGSS